MRVRALDLVAIGAVLATGTGMIWTAWELPQVIARTSFATTAVGALAGALAMMWLHRDAHGAGQDRARRDQRREEALRAQIAALEGHVRMLTERLSEAASTDDLTGVLKRRAFLERLEEVSLRDARLGRAFTLLLVDVEGFRLINAQRGRVGGDNVLKRVGRALQSVTRGTDRVGRMGGDEFAVVLGECEDPGPVVSRLFIALADGEGRGGADDAPVHVSVGSVVVANPSSGLDVARLFRLADEGLASVRGTGTSRCGRRSLDRPLRGAATA